MERVLRLSEEELVALVALLLEESGRMGERVFIDTPLWGVYEEIRRARNKGPVTGEPDRQHLIRAMAESLFADLPDGHQAKEELRPKMVMIAYPEHLRVKLVEDPLNDKELEAFLYAWVKRLLGE